MLDIVNGRDASRRDAEFLRTGGRLVSTVFGADVDWFAGQQITAFNVVGHVTPCGGTPNPQQSPQGLTEIAHLLEAGAITTRISTTAGLDGVPGVLTALRHGELHGKAAIRLR